MVYTPFKGIPETCTHERRPGTTVCLHCRHAALEETRERRQRLFLRGSAIFVAVLVFAAAGAMGATALRDRSNAQTTPLRTVRSETQRATRGSRLVASNASRASENQQAPEQAIATQAGAARPPLTSILPVGESVLPGGVTAFRTDSDVTLSFDQTMLRTRKGLKFEYWVRSTLPLIYGAPVQGPLSRIQEGGLANQGELLTELPARGLHIPLDSGWTLEVFPETRAGEDGPLVVRYRAKIVQ